MLHRGAFLASIVLALVAAFVSSGVGAEPPAIVGTWTGATQVGGKTLRAIIHVSVNPDGSIKVLIDSVDEGLKDIPTVDSSFTNGRFSFKIPAASSYSGILRPDHMAIDGQLKGGNQSVPLVLMRNTGAPLPTIVPTPTPAPAMPPVALDKLKAVLDREMEPVLRHGLLSPQSGGGLVIGVIDHGLRRIFAYGAAKPDSIFEIASIGKTFTGLTLAQMVVQKRVTLDEPVRLLLPPGFVAKPDGPEITLLDLATHHSGLPNFPDNAKPQDASQPFADYSIAQLQELLARHGLARPAHPEFSYSNLGAGLLGYALSLRAGVPFKDLVASEVTGPLHLSDTVIALSPEQRRRVIQGYSASFDTMGVEDFGLFVSMGALKSTAGDMLTYLDANMHPEKYAVGARPGTSAATFPAAVAIDHQPRADWPPDHKIALFWRISSEGDFWHTGGDNGYTAYADFDPKKDQGIVVLYNRYDGNNPAFMDRVAENVTELMAGKPSIPIDVLSDQERVALEPHIFSASSLNGSYHCHLSAFPLPATINDPFKDVAHGDMHLVADGNGKFTSGTWTHHIEAPHLDLTCNLELASGDYSIRADGNGAESTAWKLMVDKSPRAGCFQFFSPARPPATIDGPILVPDPKGKSFYSTSINRLAVLNVACERDPDN